MNPIKDKEKHHDLRNHCPGGSCSCPVCVRLFPHAGLPEICGFYRQGRSLSCALLALDYTFRRWQRDHFPQFCGE
ncbi:hypothetical protein [Klebsiella phage vB_KshKPC-M]|nr:hypothetical protein [Klebsiella phage vB_KshKPC-M]